MCLFRDVLLFLGCFRQVLIESARWSLIQVDGDSDVKDADLWLKAFDITGAARSSVLGSGETHFLDVSFNPKLAGENTRPFGQQLALSFNRLVSDGVCVVSCILCYKCTSLHKCTLKEQRELVASAEEQNCESPFFGDIALNWMCNLLTKAFLRPQLPFSSPWPEAPNCVNCVIIVLNPAPPRGRRNSGKQFCVPTGFSCKWLQAKDIIPCECKYIAESWLLM